MYLPTGASIPPFLYSPLDGSTGRIAQIRSVERRAPGADAWRAPASAAAHANTRSPDIMIFSRPVRRSFFALLALSLLTIPAAPSAAGRDPVERISKVRRAELGSTVTVRGTVTVPTDAFDPGFAMQQGNAGIYVLDSGGTPRAEGDVVEVTGTLVDSFGQLAIQPTAITALGEAEPVEPRRRKTRVVGEATEGEMLVLEGRMVGEVFDDGVFGFKVTIDDGSGPVQLFLFPGTGISTDGLRDGVAIRTVCFSSQFEDLIECNPRAPEDLIVE
jgi:hypothetical protein